MEGMTRRQFLASTALVAGAGFLGLKSAALAQPPPQRPFVPPGEHQQRPLPFAPGSLRGISEEQITLHHGRHYSGYVTNRNAIEKALAAMNPAAEGFDARKYAGLKRQETFNACGQVLHESYFSILGGNGQIGSESSVASAIRRDFGSYRSWQTDLQATANAAGVGWGVTCFDPSSGRLINFLVELHQLGAVWAAVPIVALDAWEHAYYHDYGPDKGKYFDAFFQNLHWGRINDAYLRATEVRN